MFDLKEEDVSAFAKKRKPYGILFVKEEIPERSSVDVGLSSGRCRKDQPYF